VTFNDKFNHNLFYFKFFFKKKSDIGLTEVGSRVFIFDYGGTLLHKEKYDIYIKQTLSAISGRKPTGF
jgi:hypothetical protein